MTRISSSALPILWYLARVVTPEGSVKGATMPGAPVFVLGQNDSIAWGLTTADSNVQDLFVETVDPADPSKYLSARRTEAVRGAGRDDSREGRRGRQAHDPRDPAWSRPL